MEKQKRIRQAVESVVFIALLACLVLGAAWVLEHKESRIKYDPFFERAEEYDVLLVGNSHMTNAVFPLELWRDYGITAYNLASLGNTLPVSYWTLKSALEVSSPKLVVVDVDSIDFKHKLTGSKGDAHIALDGLPYNAVKRSAIYDLMNDEGERDETGALYSDLQWEYHFTLGKYHARWSEVTREDIFYEPNRLKGAKRMIGVGTPSDYNIIDEDVMDEEYGCSYEYLRKIILLCQERGIEVMLVHLPYPAPEQAQRATNTVYWIAEEYGVPYIDFVALDQVVDYRVDTYDGFSHLNVSGANKVTDYLGRCMADWYNVPDRRQDAAYAQWEADYAQYMEEKTAAIRAEQRLNAALSLLHDASFETRIAIAPDAAVYDDEWQMRLLQNVAREHIYEEDAYAMWSDSLFPLERLEEAAGAGSAYFAHIKGPGELAEELVGEAAARERAALTGEDAPADAQIILEVLDASTGERAALLHF